MANSSLSWAWRRRFLMLTILVTVTLISWGGFVTSIDAGMAVPDWPASFGSYDPFKTGLYDANNPEVRWWKSVPVLAEHGHRLLGALVGILTIIVAAWTWWADDRRWMRWLGVGALVLVSAQGLLGGLRVTKNSVALAAVHACTAQVFFALLVAMALFTTDAWRNRRGVLPDGAPASRLRLLSYVTVGALYLQIILGALLRHLGHGVDGVFAGVHITGAFVVTGLVLAVFIQVQKHFSDNALMRRMTWGMVSAVGLQFALGLAAYVVLLYESPEALRSVWQIALTVGHLVVGALLMGCTVATALLAWRKPQTATALSGDGAARAQTLPDTPHVSA